MQSISKLNSLLRNSFGFDILGRTLRIMPGLLDSSFTAVQSSQLDNEKCILVNEQDEVVGSSSKRECHMRQSDGGFPLHRAFSVFLFNSKNELLLQQRSSTKVTFPDYFTNSCCSHPRFNTEEMEAHAYIGIKRAAQRRLNFELGIPEEQVPLDSINFLTRILYSADANDDWGEHELDYVLLCQRDVDLNINTEEVQEARYFSQADLKDFLNNAAANGTLITPWFSIIAETKLDLWWNNLSNLKPFTEESLIHKAGHRHLPVM